MLAAFRIMIMVASASFVGASIASTETSAQQKSCLLLSGLTGGEKKLGLDLLRDMMQWMSSSSGNAMEDAISLLNSFKLNRGTAFIVTNLPGYAEEHILAFDSGEQGTVYLRLVYESYNRVMRVTKFDINSPFDTALKQRSFFGPLSRIDCK